VRDLDTPAGVGGGNEPRRSNVVTDAPTVDGVLFADGPRRAPGDAAVNENEFAPAALARCVEVVEQRPGRIVLSTASHHGTLMAGRSDDQCPGCP
jgi:hypothetical protein